MHLAYVRQRNIHLEEEKIWPLKERNKSLLLDVLLVEKYCKFRVPFIENNTIGLAVQLICSWDCKLCSFNFCDTLGGNLLKPAASAQKLTLQIADANRDRPASLELGVEFDVSEDAIEGCNLEEDNCFTGEFEQQLMSTSKLSDISKENEEIEFCGPEDDPDDYSYLSKNAETNTVLNEPQPNFYYEVLEEEHAGMARCTLDEMGELFASYNDVLIM